MAEEYKRMRQLVGSPNDWSLSNLILADGEIAFERDTNDVVRAKLGDGSKTYAQAPFFSESLWASSGSYTFNRIDGPVVIGGTSGPDRLTVRGGDFTAGIYREDIPTDGQQLGIIRLGALQGTAQTASGAQIRGEAVGDWSPTNWGARLRFVVTPSGTVTEVSVAVIADDGGLVIGSATGGSQGAGTINCERLFVNGVEVIP
jgi:hypothetical protein